MSTAAANAARPLAGLRVIDITTVMLGPYATQILGDYGADVIKVEAPEGDSTRTTGPSPEPGMAATFLGANRSKRSIVLDLKQPAGRDALLTLVDGADVLVCSVRPQKMRAHGLALESLRERRPRLIVVAIQGFGEGGPYAGRPTTTSSRACAASLPWASCRATNPPICPPGSPTRPAPSSPCRRC